MANTKEKLIICAIDIIASEGLSGFAMKKVTDQVGVSEALIYKYFDTRENFLYCCFESVHKDIAALFQNISLPESSSKEEAYAIIKNLWFMYFDFLVKNGNRIVFYFEYRNSPHIKTILEHDDQAREEYFSSFVRIFNVLKMQMGLPSDFDENILWSFLLDLTGLYAVRTIRGDISDSIQDREQIWEIISGGIYGILKGD